MFKGTVYYIIRHVVKAKLRKKFKAHQLNMAQIQKRRARMGENVGDKLKFVKRDAFARGFMACAALSSRGKSVIRIIPKGTK
ncbi:hypothetical protein DPMN_070149, partial [Dreissena polymorpha]